MLAWKYNIFLSINFLFSGCFSVRAKDQQWRDIGHHRRTPASKGTLMFWFWLKIHTFITYNFTYPRPLMYFFISLRVFLSCQFGCIWVLKTWKPI